MVPISDLLHWRILQFVCLFVCLCGCIKPLKQVDLRLRIVTVPGVQEEVRKNGVETEKNRDKSSNCDVCVTCDDVRCFL